MRRVNAKVQDGAQARVHRVVELGQLPRVWEPYLSFLVLVQSPHCKQSVEQLQQSGLPNVYWVDADGVELGDVVLPQANRDSALVVFRNKDQHHALQLTNRCNSNCLMCSQPPTQARDDWLVDEALDVVRHISESPKSIGISGGEPLLMHLGLRALVETIATLHPNTAVEILSNGRLLSNPQVREPLLEGLNANVKWLIPLYGHADFFHDFVVQSTGAFEETLAGLLTLQQFKQPIQLRIVLIKPVLEILSELCAFIGRNLPFVREVAFMACEPIGFALANRDQCEVDLLDWTEVLANSAAILHRFQIPYLFMNAPLCALPQSLHSVAHKSISDWKQVYADECDACSVKADCSGLFAWHERGWKPTKIRAM